MNGDTGDENATPIGKGANPKLVLSGAARKLGTTLNMFNVSIINLETGVQDKGRSVNYQDLNDGISIMRELAKELVITDAEREDERIREAEERRKAELKAEADRKAAQAKAEEDRKKEAKAAEEQRKAEAKAAWQAKLDERNYWSIGASIGSSFAIPVLVGTINTTLSPFSYGYFELGCDFGFIHGMSNKIKDIRCLSPVFCLPCLKAVYVICCNYGSGDCLQAYSLQARCYAGRHSLGF